MRKNLFFQMLFQLVSRFLLIALLGLLYWSSLLQEERMIAMERSVDRLAVQMQSLQKAQEGVNQSLARVKSAERSSLQAIATPSGSEEQKNSSRVDPSLPNLLTPDKYYTEVLPKQLGDHFVPKGTRKSATIGRPDNLHPFSNWAQVSAWNSMCSVSLATGHVGIYNSFAPALAYKMEERPFGDEGRTEFWLHLRDDVYWAPLDPNHFSDSIQLAPVFLESHRVTAHDVKFFYDALMNQWVEQPGAIAMRQAYADIEKIEVIDDQTLVVRWKAVMVEEGGKKVPRIKYSAKSFTGSLSPLPRFVYQHFSDGTKIVEADEAPDFYRTNSVWAQNFNKHWAKNVIVSCGAWLFDGISDKQIAFKRNPDYYDPLANLVERSETYFKESNDSIWLDFKLGKLDTHTVSAEELGEFYNFLKSSIYGEQKGREGMEIHRLDYLGRAFAHVGWNSKFPPFATAKVRQAMTMMIDRKRIIDQILNGLGIEVTGPFFYYSPAYDHAIQPWPYDPIQAKRILESEGWFDRDGDGTIEKVIDGKPTPFSFALSYYVKNTLSQSISEYIASALNSNGIDCRLNGIDIADLSALFDEKNFDALYLAWTYESYPENPRQLWHSAYAKEKGSSNHIGFANAEVDAAIDALEYEYDEAKRKELYAKIQQIIHREAPYTFLYSPKVIFLYRDYVQNVFIPAERQDLIPGANSTEPQGSLFWLKDH